MRIPESYNYIGAFLTLECNLKCYYCINRFGGLSGHKISDANSWINCLNRIETRDDLPITLQGGEPTIHPEFYKIVNGINKETNIDLMTNLQFDIYEFMKNISPDRIKRKAPYASIRVSYHPQTMDLNKTIKDIKILLSNNYSIGVWMVDHPANKEQLKIAKSSFESCGIDFRTKEFLGKHQGVMYGEYKYPQGITGKNQNKIVNCSTTELLISPSLNVYQCHSFLYRNKDSIGNMNNFIVKENEYRECSDFGLCNPCDIKIKTNRFQIYGHTSVDIKEN